MALHTASAGGGVVFNKLGSNGVRDATYGNRTGSVDYALDLERRANGKFLALRLIGNGFLSVTRMLDTGALDTDYGTGGETRVDYNGEGENGWDLAVAPDGTAAVLGYTQQTYQWFVARFLPSGALDMGFGGGDGYQEVANVQGRVAVQEDGKIIVSGASAGADVAHFNLDVVRLTTTGAPDTGFGGGDGATTFSDLSWNNTGTSDIEIGPMGKIMVAGSGKTYPNWGVAKLNTDGSPDTEFSGDGFADVAVDPDYDVREQVALQPDGKVLLAGGVKHPGDFITSATLIRLDRQGSLDPSFSGDGIVTHNRSPGSTAGAGTFVDLAVVAEGTRALTLGHSGDNGSFNYEVFSNRYKLSDSPSPVQFSAPVFNATEGPGADVVTLSRPDGGAAASVRIRDTGGTATPGSDFTATGDALRIDFAAGETTMDVPVAVLQDALDENPETIQLTIDAPQGNAALGVRTSASLLIDDDDDPPTVSVEDAEVVEGNATSDEVRLRFGLRLSAPSGKVVRVSYTTAPGTADHGDFVGVTAVEREFQPGQTVLARGGDQRGHRRRARRDLHDHPIEPRRGHHRPGHRHDDHQERRRSNPHADAEPQPDADTDSGPSAAERRIWTSIPTSRRRHPRLPRVSATKPTRRAEPGPRQQTCGAKDQGSANPPPSEADQSGGRAASAGEASPGRAPMPTGKRIIPGPQRSHERHPGATAPDSRHAPGSASAPLSKRTGMAGPGLNQRPLDAPPCKPA